MKNAMVLKIHNATMYPPKPEGEGGRKVVRVPFSRGRVQNSKDRWANVESNEGK